MSRRTDARMAELEEHRALIEKLGRQVEELQEERPVGWQELGREDRQSLIADWPMLVCPFCGGAHQGMCRRIREIELDERGRDRHIWFWREGEWKPDPRTLWSEDVWENPSTMSADLRRARGDADARASLTRKVEEDRQRAEQATRRVSPREKLRQITGDAPE